MKKILVIDSCVRREKSRTKKVLLAMLEELKNYSIEYLDICVENLRPLNEKTVEQREKLVAQGDFSHKIFKYAKQFANADCIIIAAPFWDLGIPAVLKTYIENICVSGLTFEYTAQGLIKKCNAKRLVFITTCGGIADGDTEQGSRYIKALCDNLWAIENYECICAQGLDIEGFDCEEIIKNACKSAKRSAEKIISEFEK